MRSFARVDDDNEATTLYCILELIHSSRRHSSLLAQRWESLGVWESRICELKDASCLPFCILPFVTALRDTLLVHRVESLIILETAEFVSGFSGCNHETHCGDGSKELYPTFEGCLDQQQLLLLPQQQVHGGGHGPTLHPVATMEEQ